VYVVHLPSIRLGASGFASAARDESAALLGARIAADPADRLLVVGDLNGTVQDRGLDPLTSRLDVPASGFAFSWPASLPVARIDQVLGRGAVVTEVSSLDATGSDHLPVVGRVRLGQARVQARQTCHRPQHTVTAPCRAATGRGRRCPVSRP
jgi:vancomycin resistance protein VanJ